MSWFRGGDEKTIHVKSNYAISRDRARALEELRADPNVLFKVVGQETDCMCGGTCGDCYPYDLMFVDLLVQNKTILESDLIQLGSEVDWFRASSKLPLSASALEAHADAVDWASVSRSYEYDNKDAAFVRRFARRLVWPCANLRIASTDVPGLLRDASAPPAELLVRRFVPASELQSLFTADELARWADILVRGYGASVVDGALGIAIVDDVPGFCKSCIECRHMPVVASNVARLMEHLERDAPQGQTQAAAFIRQCKPPVELVERLLLLLGGDREVAAAASELAAFAEDDGLLERHGDRLDWNRVVRARRFSSDALPSALARSIDDGRVSKVAFARHVRLTEAFVDEHADDLDWYELCEHQPELSEAFLRKHVGRLNWGQVALHQPLSRRFVEDFRHVLSAQKLYRNARPSVQLLHSIAERM